MITLPPGWRVTVHHNVRGRWAYAIHEPGWAHGTSAHLYGSEDTAHKAGMADALALAALR